jgi:peptidoglycan hydrolase CwlO-like protein
MMTVHAEADVKVAALKGRWSAVHETTKEWVARMTTLVECWNKLEGNVCELNAWVTEKDSATGDLHAEDGNAIPLEKLEQQLNQLKVQFAEKQKLVTDLEEYGAAGRGENPLPSKENGEAAAPPAEALAADLADFGEPTSAPEA